MAYIKFHPVVLPTASNLYYGTAYELYRGL
jgi:hypothetical protein